ncbi:MAG: hypothetical protein IPK76_04400 [Lewinellaceae bacterium]|nr:hypothetical protein [Lewinellaceae bacterium]
MKNLLPVIIAVLATAHTATAQNRFYVNIAATGANNGASWADAFTDLQSALAQVQAGDEVWVAEGVYRPTAGNDRTLSFEQASGVALYGGFAGMESALSERDWALHLTVLSGDIGVAGDSSDNAYTVLYLEEPDTNTVVDGFTVRDGNADYSGQAPSRDRRRCGGGMYVMGENWEAYPEIRNCSFVHNTARGFGGGVLVNGAGDGSAGPYFVNCRFEDNRSVSSSGGGLARLGGSWLERERDLDGCVFLRNQAGFQGGGFYYSDSERTDTLNIVDCDFIENKAQDWGGGAELQVGRENSGSIVITGCRFVKNMAKDGGALKLFPPTFLSISFIDMNNCKFIENEYNNVQPSNLQWAISIELINEFAGKCLFKNCKILDNNGWNAMMGIAWEIDAYYIDNILVGGGTNSALNISRGSYFYLSNSIFTEINAPDCLKVSALKKKISCVNCLFSKNHLSNGYVINESNTDTLSLLNCAFVDNEINQSATSSTFDLTMQAFNCVFSDIGDYKKFFYTLKPSLISHCYFDSLDCSQLFPNVTCGPGLIIGGDPMFVAPDSGDYRLQPCSPLLNAGNNDFLSPDDTTDLAGAARVQRGMVDIGPYETPAPGLAADPVAEPSCPGGQAGIVTFSVSDGCPPFSYAWTSGSSTGSGISGLAAGAYTFTITDATGAAFTASVTVPEGDAPDIVAVQQPVICGDTLGGSATAGVAGGMPPYAWHWQGGSTDSLLSGLAAGAYPVTVTDARGCVATGTVQVTREGNLDVSIQITEISCFGAADGAFTVLPENGKAPYAWNWENGSTGPDLGPLGPGNYLGTVTDALGCSIALVLPLDEPDSLQFTATVHNASGPQASDGSIIVAPVSGGTMPYYFQWDNGGMNDTLGALLPGLYTLTLSDERGCSATGSFEVSWSSGTSEAGSRAHLLLFPNPAGATAAIQGELRDGRIPASLKIFDASGKEVRAVAMPGNTGVFYRQFTLEGMAAGTYLLRLCDAEGRVLGEGKLVKR